VTFTAGLACLRLARPGWRRGLDRTSTLLLLAAAVAWSPVRGGGDPPSRPGDVDVRLFRSRTSPPCLSALHGFTLGFVVLLIYLRLLKASVVRSTLASACSCLR